MSKSYTIFDHQAGSTAEPLEEGFTTLTETLKRLAELAQERRDEGYSVIRSIKKTKCYAYGSEGNEVNNLYAERVEEEEEDFTDHMPYMVQGLPHAEGSPWELVSLHKTDMDARTGAEIARDRYFFCWFGRRDEWPRDHYRVEHQNPANRDAEPVYLIRDTWTGAVVSANHSDVFARGECGQLNSASHSDQDIDTHNAADCACANCGHPYKGNGDSDNGYDCPKCGHNDTGDDSDDPTSVFYRVPSVVVTPSGIQFMLPGETPSPVRKGGDTDQTRMF